LERITTSFELQDLRGAPIIALGPGGRGFDRSVFERETRSGQQENGFVEIFEIWIGKSGSSLKEAAIR
jgi:hypothetical protein